MNKYIKFLLDNYFIASFKIYSFTQKILFGAKAISCGFLKNPIKSTFVGFSTFCVYKYKTLNEKNFHNQHDLCRDTGEIIRQLNQKAYFNTQQKMRMEKTKKCLNKPFQCAIKNNQTNFLKKLKNILK